MIQKTFGHLTAELHERFIKNQRFLGMKFPDMQNLDPIDKKYFRKIYQKSLYFIKSLLKMDPSERLTASWKIRVIKFWLKNIKLELEKTEKILPTTILLIFHFVIPIIIYQCFWTLWQQSIFYYMKTFLLWHKTPSLKFIS